MLVFTSVIYNALLHHWYTTRNNRFLMKLFAVISDLCEGKSQTKIIVTFFSYSYGCLKDVLFNLTLQNKLFPLPSITKKRVAVKLKCKACGITIDGKQYTIGYKHGKLYKLNTTIPNKTWYIGKTNNQEPLKFWH